MLRGYEERQEVHNTTTAYFVTNLMNLFGKSLKSSMTVEKLMKPLLGTKKKSPSDRKVDEDYLRSIFRLTEQS